MAAAVDDVDVERDRNLVLRAQAGDDLAFASLYNRYHQRLIRFAVRRVGNRADAEEIAQEAFARAYRALPDFGAERRFYSWLSVITARLCIDSLRRGWRCEVGDIVDQPMIDAAFERIERDDDVARLLTAMDRLNPRHREVLELREREGWAYQRIADHYDVSLGTVEALLWRARKALRREYEAIGSFLLGVPLVRRLIAPRAGHSAQSVATLSAFGTVAVLSLAGPISGVAAAPAAVSMASPAAAVRVVHAVVPAANSAPTTAPLPGTGAVTGPVTSAVVTTQRQVGKVVGPFVVYSGEQGQQAIKSQQLVVQIGPTPVVGVTPSDVPADVQHKLIDPVISVMKGLK